MGCFSDCQLHYTAIIEVDTSILSISVGRAYSQPKPDPKVTFTLQIEGLHEIV
jgi:hypothetical protein